MSKKNRDRRKLNRRKNKEALFIQGKSFKHCNLKRPGVYKLTMKDGIRLAWSFCKRCHKVWFCSFVIESFRLGDPIEKTEKPSDLLKARRCKLERSTDGGKTWEEVDPKMSYKKHITNLVELGIPAEISFVPRPSLIDFHKNEFFKRVNPAEVCPMFQPGALQEFADNLQKGMDLAQEEVITKNEVFEAHAFACSTRIEPDGIHYRRMEGEYISQPCCERFKCTKCGYIWKSCEEGWNDD